MATAQYESRTRTVEETVIVLALTEDEADALRGYLGQVTSDGAVARIYRALAQPANPEPAPAADTFEYNGVVYNLNATYVDRDGDVWSFTGRVDDDGTPRVTYTGLATSLATLVEVANLHGPLIKVTT